MWVAEAVIEIPQRVEQAPLLPLDLSPKYSSITPPWWTPKALPFYVTGAPRQKKKEKKKAQVKEQIKAPEKIQLSNEEIANLLDAQIKTLVIRMLTELVEYGCKIEERL